jgi:hypothetical protein
MYHTNGDDLWLKIWTLSRTHSEAGQIGVVLHKAEHVNVVF